MQFDASTPLDAVFSGSARREAARAGSEACQGSRGRVRERESGGKAHFYIEMGLPSHAALSEAGEWSGVTPEPPGDWSWTKKNGCSSPPPLRTRILQRAGDI